MSSKIIIDNVSGQITSDGQPIGGGGSSNLDGLSDVTLSSPSANQVLTYNGSAWVNSAAQGGETFSGTYTSTYVLRSTTTDATVTELTLDGSAPSGASNVIAVANDSTSLFEIMIAARRTDADNESAGYKFSVVIDRNANAASTAIIGGDMKIVFAEDTTAWDAQVDANTVDGALKVSVTGQAGKTIKWIAFVREVKSVG